MSATMPTYWPRLPSRPCDGHPNIAPTALRTKATTPLTMLGVHIDTARKARLNPTARASIARPRAIPNTY